MRHFNGNRIQCVNKFESVLERKHNNQAYLKVQIVFKIILSKAPFPCNDEHVNIF